MFFYNNIKFNKLTHFTYRYIQQIDLDFYDFTLIHEFKNEEERIFAELRCIARTLFAIMTYIL